jgi:hypothetical protein
VRHGQLLQQTLARTAQRRGWLLVALSLVACEGPLEADQPVATTTHALLRVKRSAVVNKEHEAIAEAFAGVVRVPEGTDPGPLLSANGLMLPTAGLCAPSSRDRDALAGSVGQAEFMEAGAVVLKASDAETLLAPRPFESSQAELTGVAYTTRDRAAEPLPGGADYSLKTTGSEQLPALELRVQAPELLSEVAVGGAPLALVEQLSTSGDVELSWRAGDARDLVYVEVKGADVGTLGVCAFRDAEGHGVLPAGLFGAEGYGGLSFHRMRQVAADAGEVDTAEVRFDFELTAQISFN